MCDLIADWPAFTNERRKHPDVEYVVSSNNATQESRSNNIPEFEVADLIGLTGVPISGREQYKEELDYLSSGRCARLAAK